MKPGAGHCQHAGDEMVKGTWTRKLKFGFIENTELVGLEVVWYMIG